MSINKRRARRAVRLTELGARNARPAKTAYLIWDTHQRGLALRVQPTGSKSFVAVYSRHGRPRWLHLGKADAIALSDARTMTAEVMLAVAKGGDPAAERKAERGAGTFAELAAKYVEQYAKRHNKSWRASETLIQRYVLPRYGRLAASAITRGDIKQMMSRMAASPIVANSVKAAISAIFNWGIGEEIVTANPCKLVPNYPTKSRERVLSDSELPKFWKAFGELDQTRGAALKAILLLGQRPGEVAHMRYEHIKDNWWEMPGAPIATIGWPGLKNKHSHRIWLPKPVQELLAANRNGGTGFVFASPRGGPVAKLDDGMREICKTLDAERATPHDLRRTHGSTVTRLGHGRDAMNRVQNHREGGVTDTYDRYTYETENKRVMESVASQIMALAEGRE